jgi:hypothetical protein
VVVRRLATDVVGSIRIAGAARRTADMAEQIVANMRTMVVQEGDPIAVVE